MSHASPLALFTLLLASTLPWAPAGAGSKSAPEEVAGATTIDTAEAKRLHDEGALFIDLRRQRERAEGTIPRSRYLELRRVFNETQLKAASPEGRALVMFSDGLSCLRAAKGAERAVGWGYSKVYYYRGGFPAWKGMKLPVEAVTGSR